MAHTVGEEYPSPGPEDGRQRFTRENRKTRNTNAFYDLTRRRCRRSHGRAQSTVPLGRRKMKIFEE